MNNDLMFSSVDQKWSTRWEHYHQICRLCNEGKPFDLDPAAEEATAKCSRFFTEKDNGLDQAWDAPSVYVNPPYAHYQKAFVSKAIEEVNTGNAGRAVLLLPSRTDTGLFHDLILPNATEVLFLQGRLVFGCDSYWEGVWEEEYLPNGKPNNLYKKVGTFNAAPFPSMVVTFERSSAGVKFTSARTVKAKYKYNKQDGL